MHLMRTETNEPSLDDLFGSAASASDFEAGLETLRRRWPSVIAERGAYVRELLDAAPGELWQDDPWLIAAYAASYRSLGSESRSAALPYFAAARAIMTEQTDVAVRIGVLLHEAAAYRSLGRLHDASASANAAAALASPDTTMPLAWRIRFSAKTTLQLGVVHYHLGDYDRALRELRQAGGLATGNLFAGEQVECRAALAMVEYSMGNFDRVLENVRLARQASHGTGLIESTFGAGALIAELLVAVEQSRQTDAEALAPLVARASERSDWEALGLYSRAAISIISERYVEGLDLLRQCLQSYRHWNPPGSIITMSEGLRATLLLRLGETHTAWDILGSLVPTQHHANCPGRFIAHLRFTNGDAAGALSALRDCEELGDAHSSRTLVDVLLIKAAAHYALGATSVADVALDRALRLAARFDMRIPFRLIPDEVMRTMLSRAATRDQPPDVHALFDLVHGAAAVASGVVLSDRERDIVRALMRNLAAPAIAEELFISVNTVKSHVKNVYRKLGVSSRAEAILRARALGLQLDITLD
jgi:LuxR family maltose regulon positive regulatory protein